MEQKNSDGRIGRSKEIMLQSFQFPIISSIARYTFVIGGLQSSKTFMGSLWLLDRISKHPDCDHLITAPTTKRLNQSTKDRFEEVLPKGWLRWQEKKSQYNILFGHGIVYVRTVGDDPRALDGCTVISWLGDECGEYKKLTWEIGKARLGKENGCAFLVSNMNVPPNWVYYDCFNEFKKGNSDYVFYSVDTEQNKYFNKKLLEEEKRLLSPDDYDRKYGHRFIAMQGKVYKEFDKECDLILPARMILDGKYKILVGLDFGFNDPSAAIFVAKKDRVYYVLDEISMSGISYTEFANMIKRVVAGREYTSAESITYYADPSEKQAVVEIGSQGITPIVPGISDIRDGIRTITSLMRGRRLFFNSGLTNLFTEFEAYHYPPIEGTRYEVVKEVPVDKENHLLDCYSDDTEVLTENGWKFITDVSLNEKIATLNANRTIDYQYPTDKIVEPYKGKMIEFTTHGRSLLLVTPNHKMFVVHHQRNDKTPELVEAKNLNIWDKILLTGNWEGKRYQEIIVGNKKIPAPAFFSYLGWFLAEGSCLNHKAKGGKRLSWEVFLSQKNKAGRKKIKELLRKMPYHFQEQKKGFLIQSKDLWLYLQPLGNTYTKRFPRWLIDAHRELLEIAWQSYIDGDGWRSNGLVACASVSRGLIDDWQEIALKRGKCLGILKRKCSNCNSIIRGRKITATRDQYWGIEWKRRYQYLRNSKNVPLFHYVDYEGLKVCLTIPNHTMYVRRNGKPMWSGNSSRYCLHTDVVLNNEMGVVLATAKPEEVKEMSVEEYRKHKDDYLIKINLDRINTQRDTPYGGYYY